MVVGSGLHSFARGLVRFVEEEAQWNLHVKRQSTLQRSSCLCFQAPHRWPAGCLTGSSRTVLVLTMSPSPQRLAFECLSQSFDSAKHSPTLVPTATKPDAVQAESLPYTQYLSMIKSQISCAKDIHNALLECSNKITGKVPSQGVL